MSNDDKFIVLLEKISEIGERTARMEAEQRNMKDDIEEVKRQDVKQNELLAEHISGVETANARLDNEIKVRELLQAKQDSLENRVGTLEETPKFEAKLKEKVISIGAILGAAAALIKLLQYFGF